MTMVSDLYRLVRSLYIINFHKTHANKQSFRAAIVFGNDSLQLTMALLTKRLQDRAQNLLARPIPVLARHKQVVIRSTSAVHRACQPDRR